jgi:Mg2+ and Co2+ transporter CorA
MCLLRVQQPYGLWLSVSLIVVISVTLFISFKRRDWL